MLKFFIHEKKTFGKYFYSWRDCEADFTKNFADLSIKKTKKHTNQLKESDVSSSETDFISVEINLASLSPCDLKRPLCNINIFKLTTIIWLNISHNEKYFS